MAERTLDAWCAAKIGAPGSGLSAAALADHQLAQLNATLHRVRTRSAYYGHYLADAPQQLAGLADLQALPFTTAEDIRRHGLQFLCVSQDSIQRVVTLDSSGTTGTPKRIYFTGADQELTIDFFHAGMATFTDPGDRVLILLPGATPGSVGDLLACGLQRLGAQPIKHGLVQDVDATLAIMRRERVDCVVGVPCQVHALAAYGAGLRLKHVLLTTDHVPDAVVAGVAAAWGCAVYNHYGMTEMGLGGGVDCAGHRGYHLREADLYFEIVDPATGQVLPDGVPGEVVFTTLTRTGMPLIRYRTGDMSRFVPGVCSCGTALRTLARVTTRTGAAAPVGPAHVTLAELDEALFAIPGLLNFSATFTSGGRDCLKLEIQTMEGQADAIAAAADAALATIPVVETARRAGILDLDMAVNPAGYHLAGPSKRTLGMHRTA